MATKQKVSKEVQQIEARKRAWAKRWGLTESRAHPCIKSLLGRRCGGLCAPLPGGDHATLWNLDGKPWILLTQPYGIDGDTLAQLHAMTRENGLGFYIDTVPSWHYPGHVLSIQIGREEALAGEPPVR